MPADGGFLGCAKGIATRQRVTEVSEGVAGYIRDSKGKVTDQFRRALRGEAVLQPRDLAYAIHHFGDDLDVSTLLAGANA